MSNSANATNDLIGVVDGKKFLTTKGLIYIFQQSKQVRWFEYGYRNDTFFADVEFVDEKFPHQIRIETKEMIEKINCESNHSEEFIATNLERMGVSRVIKFLFKKREVHSKMYFEANEILAKLN